MRRLHAQRISYIFGLILLFAPQAFTDEPVPFDPTLPADTICKVEIAKVRPTQFAVGKWEVDRRLDKITKMNSKKFNEYMKDHQATIVIGPEGTPYLTDGHHLCSALDKSKLSTTVEAKVAVNLSRLSPDLFWTTMKDNGWTYLYDEKGDGPLEINKLPKTVAELADDPYRSLAWAVRERGGWNKSPSSFAEFQWAQFYRKRIAIDKGPGGFEKAVEEAIKLSHSPDAKDLPGYTPAK